MEGQILIFRTSIRNARDIKHIAALFTSWNGGFSCSYLKKRHIPLKGYTVNSLSCNSYSLITYLLG